MLTKTTVLKHLADARKEATAEEHRLFARGETVEAVDQRRPLDVIEREIRQELAKSPGEVLTDAASEAIGAILAPYAHARAQTVSAADAKAVSDVAQRQRRSWGQR